MTKENQTEEIGLLRDKCENLLCAASLPMPPVIHVQGLTAGLREIQERLATLYTEIGGTQ